MSVVDAIGVLSGTSVDAIDVVWVRFTSSQQKPVLQATYQHPIPNAIRQAVFALMQPGDHELVASGRLDVALGQLFGQAVLGLMAQEKLTPNDVTVIGSHGQTVRHHPDATPPFTVQLGDPNAIVATTGCPVVADFRRRDMAEGGQGAPLAPAFHQAFLTDDADAVVNIGGIANVSLLASGSGFDTGPGNGLLDAWAQKHLGIPMDEDGRWAQSGVVQPRLLEAFLLEPFFIKAPPKSTGKELFNLDWLQSFAVDAYKPEDVQATLVELTAISIAQSLDDTVRALLVCGGGAKNPVLLGALQRACGGVQVVVSDEKGWPAEWLEGMLFAWLAKKRWCQEPIDLSCITGGAKIATLGGLYVP